MQLILDTETSVDLKTKMSLNDDYLEKCVSDIQPGVQSEGISNDDITNGNKEDAKLKEDNDVDKIELLKDSVPLNSDSVMDLKNETTFNIGIEAFQDCESTGIPNGNNSDDKELVVNSEIFEKSHNINESDEGKDINVEKDHIQDASNCEETESNYDNLTENTVIEPASQSENIEEPTGVFNNIKTDLTVPSNSDMDTTHTDLIRNSESNDNNNGTPCESANIKIEIDETVSNNIPTNLSETCNIEKEIELSSDETKTETDPIEAIKEPLHDDLTPNLETSDTDMKQMIMKTEIAENAPVFEQKDSKEKDTEADVSDDTIDLIHLDVNHDSRDKANDFPVQKAEKEEMDFHVQETEKDEIDLHVQETEKDEIALHDQETEKEEINITDSVEKESLRSNGIVEMDRSASHNNEAETKEINDTPTEDIPETKDCEFVEIDITKTVEMLDLNLKSSEDVVVNLDEEKEKPVNSVNFNKTDLTQIIIDDDKPVINCDDDTEMEEKAEKSVLEDANSVDEIIDLDESGPKETRNSKLSTVESKNQEDNTNKKTTEDSKPIEPVLKLSNTLNILSEDEDDDVMLIDDDTSGNENKATKEHESEKPLESKSDSVKMTDDRKSPDEMENIPKKDATVPEKEVAEATPTPDMSKQIEENKLQIENQKPLIPENFLKTCKKNLVDMTREELEEFCILKIVESVLDRSNLSEIKNKLKVLTQNIEDYKKKAMVLSKQNRDLQVVLKSVQEDVKKSGGAPIVPLKITRSVGMQVLMFDKPDKRRRAGIGLPNTKQQLRNPAMQSPRPQKTPTQQIPVPRLVPANNPAIKSPNVQQQATTGKVVSPLPLPNGVKNVSPVQKAEKRTHNRMQSVTVDLTDDEPPAKVVNRTQGPVPPVRLVPSQNLLAAPRTPGVNSPRKVYIPISGPQGQNVRPGQTIMLKTVPASNPRQRVPTNMVRMPQSIRMTRPQGLRHPAPLPECMKQYQPPNWKALPPAPDLKLAKVENGIVISWKIEGYQEDSYEEIASYQLYAYQETSSPPNTALWKKIGDVKALPLPMACTLTQFMAGYKYYFAVRAVDIRSRLGPFSLPGSILLLNKM